MGNDLTRIFAPHLWREDEPYSYDGIKYDPQFGFEKERSIKGPNATELMMDSACLYKPARDSCALQYMRYEACHQDSRPFIWKCAGLLHEYEECYINERIHDMKEFERERRLNKRERLLKEKSGQ